MLPHLPYPYLEWLDDYLNSTLTTTMVSNIKGGVFLVLLVIVVAIVVRTINLSKPKAAVQECKAIDADYIPLDDRRLSNFQQALHFKTISWTSEDYSPEELLKFGNFIIDAFPRIHKSPDVEWERVNNYSLLYHVKGSNSNLKPYLLMSHLDVVPVTDPDVWDAPPFSGEIVNGFIYGRGTIDVKQTAMGILEALEYLLSQELRPERSFFIAFGHDEEVDGVHGAKYLSQRLSEKGITELEYISDEGLPITKGIITGVQREVASFGVVEKGQVVLKLSVNGVPGHSSMPPKESTIGILAKAVYKLESNPLPSMLGSGVEIDTFESLAPEMNILQRMFIANVWLFKPLVSWFISKDPVTNSIIRTVTSVSMFNAGVKNNIIPSYAEAFVNHRIHPSQTVQEVIDYDTRLIGDDRVNIEVMSRIEPHPVAGYGDHDFGYQVLKTSVLQLWPDAVVVPGILVGNTDTKYYLRFTNNVYRFNPTYMLPGDTARFHGNNERISVKNYEQVINFYYHLMKNSDQQGVSPVHKPHEEF